MAWNINTTLKKLLNKYKEIVNFNLLVGNIDKESK